MGKPKEMAQPVWYSVCKPEDLSSESQHPGKMLNIGKYTCNPITGGGQVGRQEYLQLSGQLVYPIRDL